MKPTIKLTRHEFSGCPIVTITLVRPMKELISVVVRSEYSRLDTHKIEVRPSCAVMDSQRTASNHTGRNLRNYSIVNQHTTGLANIEMQYGASNMTATSLLSIRAYED